MKIGSNSIQGIFLFSESCSPEIDDFVIYNGNLWICNSNSPSGYPSEENSDYSLYMSPNIAETSEVIDILKTDNAQWVDKAIKLSTIPDVLDYFFHGLTNKGIIKDSDYVNLSDIVSDSDHNRGMYAFSRTQSDVIGLVSQDYDTPVFIKKYTYKTIDGNKYILLELFDYEDGALWFRCYSAEDGYPVSEEWKAVNPPDSIKTIIETLVNQYKSRISSLDSIEERLKNNFKFTKLVFPEDSEFRVYLNGTKSVGTSTSFPIIPNCSNLDFTINIIIYSEETGLNYTGSCTIPGVQSLKVNIPFSLVQQEITLNYSLGYDSVIFSLQNIPSGYTAKISSIYYQDFYE